MSWSLICLEPAVQQLLRLHQASCYAWARALLNSLRAERKEDTVGDKDSPLINHLKLVKVGCSACPIS